jgi:HK97 family phage major capsid protein
MFRAATISLLSRVEQKTKLDVLRERYGEDEPTKAVMDSVTKAASAPATTTTVGWAAELVATAILDFIDTLMPQSVYPGLSARGGRFTFGRNGVVSLPARNTTTTISGSFVGQGAPIPVRQGAFTATTLTPKKMGVISTFTREIAEHSTPSIEALIRQAIQEDTSVSIDSVLLDAVVASAIRPAGLRAGVSVTTATAGGGFNALVGDVKALVGALVTASGGNLRTPVWIMNPVQALSIAMTQNAGGDFPFAAEVNQGRLQGYTILQSTSVTAGMVFLVDASDFFSATGDDPRFDVSDQAVLHMEDTTPLAIGTAGSPNTVAAPARSLWQTDTIGIRMLLDINWAMRRTGSIVWTQAVTW